MGYDCCKIEEKIKKILKKIIVAIDGYSSCGKSTLAKALAARLGYGYVDTGAMYRAITLHLMRLGVDVASAPTLEDILDNIRIEFKSIAGKNYTFLNGRNVESDIRSLLVSNKVSEVAAIPAVRRKLVQQQQDMGKFIGIVMDGRDIGTVVFPDAELKIFMTAEPNVRAQRRLLELNDKKLTVDVVLDNLKQRDYIDSTREDSPLRQAEDAYVMDNTTLSPDEQLNIATDLAQKAIENLHKTFQLELH